MVNGEKVTQSSLTPFPITDRLLRTTAYKADVASISQISTLQPHVTHLLKQSWDSDPGLPEGYACAQTRVQWP